MENVQHPPIIEKICFVDGQWLSFMKRAHEHQIEAMIEIYFGKLDFSKYLFYFLPILHRCMIYYKQFVVNGDNSSFK